MQRSEFEIWILKSSCAPWGGFLVDSGLSCVKCFCCNVGGTQLVWSQPDPPPTGRDQWLFLGLDASVEGRNVWSFLPISNQSETISQRYRPVCDRFEIWYFSWLFCVFIIVVNTTLKPVAPLIEPYLIRWEQRFKGFIDSFTCEREEWNTEYYILQYYVIGLNWWRVFRR